MASDGITVRLEGVDELKRALAGAGDKIRKNAVRGSLRQAAKVIVTQARANAPVLAAPRKGRASGTIKKNIVARNSKFARRDKNEGVYVSVRPLRGARTKKLGRASADNPNDPYYWWFVEFGTRPHTIKPRRGKKFLKIGSVFVKSVKHPGAPGKRFMTRAADQKGQEAVAVFLKSVIPQIEKLNARASGVR